jgi:riboflavin kinase
MPKNTDLQTLLLLAKRGAHEKQVEISLNELARRLGSSKQTAARRLESLERKGFVSRTYDPKGQGIKMTAAGLAELKAIHLELGNIFKKRRATLKFSGLVTTGFGEGGYYVGQPQYLEKFKEELGYVPYPGTLDVKVGPESRDTIEVLLKLPGREIKGFKTKERTFGSVKLFSAKLNGVGGALVLPVRSHHRDVLEFIATQNLRKTLKLRDGSRVELEVEI